MEKEQKPSATKEFFNGFDDDILNPDDFNEVDEGKGNDEKSKVEGEEGSKKPDDQKPDDNKSNPNPTETEKGKGNPDDEGKTENKDNQKSDEEKEKEKNAYYAELRRKKEADEKARLAKEREALDKQIKDKATIEGKLSVLKTNPYTNEPINDEEDLNAYEIMRELESKGKDPVKDYAKEIANRNRIAKQKAEELEKSKKEADAKQQERAKKEVEEFSKLHPEVDLGKLAADEDFQNFAQNKFGRWTLDEIYSAYAKPINKAKDNETDEKKVKELAKKQSKAPNPNPNGNDLKKDYLSMSDEEYIADQKKNGNGDFF